MYLGIAIFDKFWQKAKETQYGTGVKANQVIYRVATCLWIAWKFNEVKSIPLNKLCSSFSITDLQLQQLVETEAEILQKIDFEIPLEFPYLELIDSYEKRVKDKSNSTGLVSQCLGFLNEGIMHSSDFSLVSVLGKHILSLYSSRNLRDPRVKHVYGLIKHKRERQNKKETQVC